MCSLTWLYKSESDYPPHEDSPVVGRKGTYKYHNAHLYGDSAGRRNTFGVSTFRRIIRNVLRSSSGACPVRIISELTSSSNGLRMSTRGRRADAEYTSDVMLESRVLNKVCKPVA